jgi:hypothetical protein
VHVRRTTCKRVAHSSFVRQHEQVVVLRADLRGVLLPEAGFWMVVAVGTTIADRPPHRSVRARLRIRLLPRMNGVEALVRIRMQNMRVRNPPVHQGVETIPSHLRALTATD